NISVQRTLARIATYLDTSPAMVLAASKTLRDPRFYELVLAKLPALAKPDRLLAIQVLAGSIVDDEAPDEYLEPTLRTFDGLDPVARGRVDGAPATLEKRRKLGYADLAALAKLAQQTKATYDSKWRDIVGQRFRITGKLDGRGYLPLVTPLGGGAELRTNFGLD